MPTFRYVAIDPAGKLAHGVMKAADEASVITHLQRQGHIPMRADPARRDGMLRGLLTMEVGYRGMRAQDVADFTSELSIMLGAGQDLDRAMRFLADTAPNPRTRVVMGHLRETIRGGGSLASALTRAHGFSQLYVGLVRAGEAAGSLAPTLARLATLLERQRSLASTVKSAMVYPAILLVAAIGSVTLLLTVVLPQFVPMFEQNGAPLPASTQMLIIVGHLLGDYGLYMLAVVLLLILAIRQALQRPGPRLMVDRLVLRLPVIGSLARETLAARFTQTLGTLLLNGVPLIGALSIVRDSIGNQAGVVAVDAATLNARGGEGLARPLGEAGIFPIRTIHLLRLGEETAQLGVMALRAAEIHEEKARIGVQRLVALLVPAITIIMGALIAGIISSLLLAMLSLNDLAN